MRNTYFFKKPFQKLFSIVALTCILTGTFSVSAQKRRVPISNRTVADKTKDACLNCWSGVITYRKLFMEEMHDDSPVFGTVDKQNERIIKDDNRNYEYDGTVVVDGSSGQAVTSTKVFYDYGETNKASQTEWTNCHSHENPRLITESAETRKNARAEAAGEARSFDFSIVGEKVRLGVTFPDAFGKFTEKNTITRKNFCPNSTRPPSETDERSRDEKVTGAGFSIEGDYNPKSPNEINGTKTWEEKSGKSLTIYKVTWKMRRKSPPLMIVDLKFFQLNYPSPNSWQEIDNYHDHTIDGNEVKVVATIVNLSGEEKSTTVNFKELNANLDLPQGSVSAQFKPHEQKDVEYIWDTSGFAWKEAAPYNEPDIFRRIKATIPDDYLTEEVEVNPKPVIFIPGMWTNLSKFKNIIDSFRAKKYQPWSVDFTPVNVMKKAADNAPIIDKKVREVQLRENAWHVDLIAHSTGGLGARAYIDSLMPSQYDNRPSATHLIMLGTPNLGTPCASGVDNVITRFFNRNPEAFGELSHKNMLAFNQNVTSRHGTKFYSMISDTFSPTCQLDEAGDGVVPFISGAYASKKYVTTNLSHEDLGSDSTVFPQIIKWIAIPPKGDHSPDNSQAINKNSPENNFAALENRDYGKTRNYGAMFLNANFTTDEDLEPNFATGVKLKANESTEIEIPVTSGSELSLILYTSPNVSATLVDDKGETVGTNLAGSPEAAQIFRVIRVKKAFQNGKWKLKLESRETMETQTVITMFIDYNLKNSKVK